VPRKSSIYECQNCGSETSQYFGRCSICGEWNSLIEKEQSPRKRNQKSNQKKAGQIKSKNIAAINNFNNERFSSGFKEFDRVLGGGFIKGSIILVGGNPGIGKSTLLLQTADKISKKQKVLYVTAEESLHQVKIRWSRLKSNNLELNLLAETELSEITQEIELLKPELIIIDSIQTIFDSEISSSPGSISQVRDCAATLNQIAKSNEITLLIIGHVTKEGNIAGPKTLEHLVDVVLTFEGEEFASHRILRSIKNRYGATHELGIFEMDEKGLNEVKSPSSFFINREECIGLTTTITAEGSRPFAIDIQSLTNETYYPNPRRITTGVSINRLHQILAVIEKKLNLKLSKHDCYLSAAGGFCINDPAADLAIAMAIISSFTNKKVQESCVVIGEIGLSGQIRPTNKIQTRLEESKRLGFKKAIIPLTKKEKTLMNDLEVFEADNINVAMEIAFGN
tara:strand:+ start:3590 stop:4948 length:1359 start_codon:yes stop_codon:yes gene_type:complete